jgi:peroxiredoxin Q/BCP
MTALKVGDPAPDFELQDSNGQTVNLRELRGKKVVLYFFTSPGGNNCTRMALGYREHAPALSAKNTIIYGINDKDAAACQAWVEKEGLPFTVLIDADRAVGIAYGMSSAASERYVAKAEEGRRPAVVIDEQGHIAAWEPDMNSVEQVAALIERL